MLRKAFSELPGKGAAPAYEVSLARACMDSAGRAMQLRAQNPRNSSRSSACRGSHHSENHDAGTKKVADWAGRLQ